MSSNIELTIHIICNLIENVIHPLSITDLRQGPSVRMAGIEPAPRASKTRTLPLRYTLREKLLVVMHAFF